MGEKPTDEVMKKLHEASEMIIKSLDWEKSRKGYQFWEMVWLEVDRILQTGEP